MSTLTRKPPTRNHAAHDHLARDPQARDPQARDLGARDPQARDLGGPRALARERDLPQPSDPYITHAAPQERSRLYRGRTVDELIPRIVAELGEDAIVLRHHTGLGGGFAGFFQKPFVEIEACRGSHGGQRLDRYDEDDAAPALPGEFEDNAAPALPREFEDNAAPALPREFEDYHAPIATDDWDEPRGVGGAHIDPSHDAPVQTDNWEQPREVWATNPFAAALAEAEAAVRAAEPTVPPDLDAALAAALAEAEAAGLPPEPTIHPDQPEPIIHSDLPEPTIHSELPEPTIHPELPEPTIHPELPEALTLEVPAVEAASVDSLPPAAGPLDELPPVAEALTVTPPSIAQASAREEIERSLLDVGIAADLVHELIAGAIAHVLPLTPPSTSLAQAVRIALMQRIPTCPPLPAAGAAIAVVGAGGSGKSACCTALLEAYREHSTLPATCATLVSGPTHPAGDEGELLADLHLLDARSPEPLTLTDPGAAATLREAREGGLLLLDTPPVSCADPASIGALAAQLALLEPDRVVLALPATLGARPAGQLLEALRPLGASALVITHADATDQLGVAIQAAYTFGLAPTYLLEGGSSKARIAQIDPSELVARLLPHR